MTDHCCTTSCTAQQMALWSPPNFWHTRISHTSTSCMACTWTPQHLPCSTRLESKASIRMTLRRPGVSFRSTLSRSTWALSTLSQMTVEISAVTAQAQEFVRYQQTKRWHHILKLDQIVQTKCFYILKWDEISTGVQLCSIRRGCGIPSRETRQFSG